MKNRASSHLFALFLIVGFEVLGYYAVHRAGLIRGYDTSWVQGMRDLLMYVPIIFIVFWLTRAMGFKGNWTLYTTAILLFSMGMLVQYRLYADPEYNAKNKAEAREKKTQTLRTRYINEHYDAEKKRRLGLPPTPPRPTDLDKEPVIRSDYTAGQALTSSYTWIPIFSFLAFALAFTFCVRDSFLLWVQRHSFIIVLITLVPLTAAVG